MEDKKRKRSAYMCRACGQPKKNHVCPVRGDSQGTMRGTPAKKAKPRVVTGIKIVRTTIDSSDLPQTSGNEAAAAAAAAAAAVDHQPLVVTPQVPMSIKAEKKEEMEENEAAMAIHLRAAMASTQPRMYPHSAMAAHAALAAAKLFELPVTITMDELAEARLTDDLGKYLVRFLHKAIVRRPRVTHVALPVRVRAPVWPSIIDILYERYAGCLQLTTAEEIEELLKEGTKREWTRTVEEEGRKIEEVDGWATITPPLIVHFDPEKGDFVAQLHYAIFNEYGVLQFPHKWY